METGYEWWGVLIGLKKELNECKSYLTPHSSRMIEVQFKMEGPPMTILGVYAPHENSPIEEKQEFFNKLNNRVQKISKFKRL